MSLNQNNQAYDFGDIDILVVDDNVHVLAIVRRLLASMRVKNVRTAVDAADAFEAMRARAPDLIILDWNMIPIDGIEFIRLVRRATDIPCPEVPILMLTAHTEAHRVITARDAGVNWVTAKPVSFQSLYESLVRIVESDRAFVKSAVYIGPDRRARRAGKVTKERRGTGNKDGTDGAEEGDAS